MTISISDKEDFSIRNITKFKMRNFMKKTYACSQSQSFKIFKQKVEELKGEIDKSTNKLGDFYTPSVIDRTSNREISKVLSIKTLPTGPSDIIHPTTAEYFFSRAHRTFIKIYYVIETTMLLM